MVSDICGVRGLDRSRRGLLCRRSPHDVHAALTRGPSKAGRAQLLRNAMAVKCRPGDVVLGVGDGGRHPWLRLPAIAAGVPLIWATFARFFQNLHGGPSKPSILLTEEQRHRHTLSRAEWQPAGAGAALVGPR